MRRQLPAELRENDTIVQSSNIALTWLSRSASFCAYVKERSPTDFVRSFQDSLAKSDRNALRELLNSPTHRGYDFSDIRAASGLVKLLTSQPVRHRCWQPAGARRAPRYDPCMVSSSK